MNTAEFDFELDPQLIAQVPATEREQSRLLVLHRESSEIEHRPFRALPDYLRAGDVLVLNNSRVIPARLRGANAGTGGRFELLLIEENSVNDWWAMMRPGKRARVGTAIILLDTHGRPTPVRATVLATNAEGHRRLEFTGAANILNELERIGEVPLPPYITRADASRQQYDRERYQTVFARQPGSVAAPTAGLHFSEPMLAQMRARGVQICFVTLHVGLGTFAPVKSDTVASHVMHEERFELSEESARIINEAKHEGRRVVAVGTTSVRVLENAAQVVASSEGRRSKAERNPKTEIGNANKATHGEERRHETRNTQYSLMPGSGKTRIFIYPPYDFKIADGLLTNFHLPRSTLLMLVSAFAAPNETRGREMVLSAYAAAIRDRYRFFSYGDAMFVV